MALLPLLVAGATALAAGEAAARRPAHLLAAYSFEDDTPTGPDTFRIFEYSKGTVNLTTAFHVSGYRAIEIRDVAGDGSMPEIQGYFPLRERGRVYAHFSFLVATPKEQFNVALAGPAWFQVRKDGIGFWLQGRDGKLAHHSGGRFEPLFDLEAFVWYTADVAYDVEAGLYDLSIRREGEEAPLVALTHRRNAAGEPGSSVDKFSFVGEPWGDASNVVYYVDDIVVGTDERLRQHPFVAPGRRKLFLDWFTDYQTRERGRPRCLPAFDARELGLTAEDGRVLAAQGLLDGLLGAAVPDLTGEARGNPRLEAVSAWAEGCRALESGRPGEALERFTRAGERAPGRLYELSRILALVALGRFAQADESLGLAYSDWREDPRYAVVSALAGSSRGDLERAEDWLREPAEALLGRGGDALLRDLRSGRISRDLIESLRRSRPDDWRAHLTAALVSEQYFYVLLWRGRPEAAREYALRMVERFQSLGLPPADWLERAGDAAFYARDLAEARELYERVLALDSRWPPWLKLSDIAFLSGDLAGERRLREMYWGALRER